MKFGGIHTTQFPQSESSVQPTVVFPHQNNINRTLLEHSTTHGHVFAKFKGFPPIGLE